MLEKQKPKYRRTQYLVARKFQLKYVGLILILVFLTGILCAYVVYYTSMLLLGDKLANVYPQGRLISIVNSVNLRILFSLILLSPLIIIIGIYASHKIAGPIYRIERFLNNMAEGDFSSRLTLRRNDELINLANGINRVVDSVRGTIKEEKANLGKVSISLQSLKMVTESESINHARLNEAMDKLSDEIARVNIQLDKYRI